MPHSEHLPKLLRRAADALMPKPSPDAKLDAKSEKPARDPSDGGDRD